MKYLVEKVQITIHHKIACLLNTNFRTLQFLTQNERTGVLSHLVDVLKDNESQAVPDAEHGPENSSQNETIVNKFKSSAPRRDIATELRLYNETAYIEPDETVLNWWKRNSFLFPNLAKVARVYLAIPASNTTSERVFSMAGHIIQKRRTNLSPQNVDKILFVHFNLD